MVRFVVLYTQPKVNMYVCVCVTLDRKLSTFYFSLAFFPGTQGGSFHVMRFEVLTVTILRNAVQ
jgi:hypothetical protein